MTSGRRSASTGRATPPTGSPAAEAGRAVALLVAGAMFMELFDGTVLTTAVARIARSFHVGVGAVALPITIYLTTVAALIPVSGWIADRYGARRVFMTAVSLFTLASAVCAASPDLAVLTTARVVQGIGGALMVPVGRLIVLRGARPENVIRAIAYLTWPALAAPLIAPVVGGLITTYASWRWIFVVNLPLGVIALLCTGLIGDSERVRRPLDWTGFGLSAVALVALTVAASLFAQPDVPLAAAIGLLAVAVLGGLAAVRHLRRAAHPLLALTVLRVRTFRVTMSGGSAYRIAINGVPFLVPLLLQERFGWTPARAGLYLSALFLGNMAIKPATGPLFRWFGFRRTLLAIVVGGAGTIAACAFLRPGVPPVLIVLVLVLSGMFRSIGFTIYNALSMADLDPGEVGQANTLFSTVQQLGVGLGVTAGALSLRIGTALTATDAYSVAFGLLALLMIPPLWEAITLPADAGRRLLSRPVD